MRNSGPLADMPQRDDSGRMAPEFEAEAHHESTAPQEKPGPPAHSWGFPKMGDPNIGP